MSNHYLTIISDTHLGKNKYFSVDVVVRAFCTAIDRAANSEYKIVIHAGDLFDKSIVSAYELNAFAKIAAHARDKNVELWIIDGNHGRDKSDQSVISHYGSYEMSHVNVVSEKAKAFKIDQATIVLNPFSMPFQDALAIRKRNSGGFGLLIGHEDVMGANYDSGQISTSGVSKDDVMTFLESFSVIGMGHIHFAQNIDDKGRAFFIGACNQFNHKSVGQMLRGYMTVDVNTSKTHRYPLVGDGWPQFLKEEWNPDAWGGAKNLEHQGAYMWMQVEHDAEESDEEIQTILLDAGVNEEHLRIERAVPVREIQKRSTIAIDDDQRVMGKKFADMKIENEGTKTRYLGVLEDTLVEIGE